VRTSPTTIWPGGRRAVSRYFPEYLPACFERTLEFTQLRFVIGRGQGALEWVFTGEEGGITIEINNLKLQVRQRFYDSEGHHPPERYYDREGRIACEPLASAGPLLAELSGEAGGVVLPVEIAFIRSGDQSEKRDK